MRLPILLKYAPAPSTIQTKVHIVRQPQVSNLRQPLLPSSPEGSKWTHTRTAAIENSPGPLQVKDQDQPWKATNSDPLAGILNTRPRSRDAHRPRASSAMKSLRAGRLFEASQAQFNARVGAERQGFTSHSFRHAVYSRRMNSKAYNTCASPFKNHPHSIPQGLM
jgi:hypothetical protein